MDAKEIKVCIKDHEAIIRNSKMVIDTYQAEYDRREQKVLTARDSLDQWRASRLAADTKIETCEREIRILEVQMNKIKAAPKLNRLGKLADKLSALKAALKN